MTLSWHSPQESQVSHVLAIMRQAAVLGRTSLEILWSVVVVWVHAKSAVVLPIQQGQTAEAG